MAWNRQWRPYVPVARRRAEARRSTAALRKRGVDVQPIEIEGRGIARTFWGKAWCDHLESLGDYSNRIPRGRTYVRNGSVCHLAVRKGRVDALVSGSEMYSVEVRIRPLGKRIWTAVRKRCAGRIGSLLELLRGDLSDQVMAIVTDRNTGLFPKPKEIEFSCDCPDWASMCKHIAAVLYGVGARLDSKPELLFRLRGVDQEELIAADAEQAVSAVMTQGSSKRLAQDGLGDVFGIELDHGAVGTKTPRRAAKRKKTVRKKAVRKKVMRKTAPRKKTARKKAVRKTATRKKAARKKAVRKTATRKKAARKKVVRKKAVRKKAVRKKAARKKAARKKAARKKAVRKTATKKKAARKKVVRKKAVRT